MSTNIIVADIQIHASLIEDYLYTQDAPVAPGPAGRFVSVFDGSVSHLLTVDSSGQMLHFMPDTNSQSGWQTTTVPVPAPPGAQEMFSITAFFAFGYLNAVVLFSVAGGYATTWMLRSAQGQWSQPNITFEASSLLSVVSQVDSYIDGSGNPYIYGMVPPCLGSWSNESSSYQDSAQFYICFLNSTIGEWDILYQSSLADMQATTATRFHIIPSAEVANSIQIVWTGALSAVFALATITPNPNGFEWYGGEEDPQVVPALGVGMGSVIRILPFPGESFPDCIVFLNDQGIIGVCGVNLEQQIYALNGGGFPGPARASAITISEVSGPNRQVVLFAIETGTNCLWVMRQGVGGQDPFMESTWTNLGNLVEAIAAPEVVQDGAEVYFAGPTLNVFHLAQNPTDNVWAMRKIAAPTDSTSTPTPVSAIMMQVTVVDANGNSVPNASLTLASDQWADIVVDDYSFMPGPGSTIPITADACGNASVYYQATSLAMPVFTFTSDSATRWCQGDVVEVKNPATATPVSPSSIANRLAGNDPNHPLNSTTLSNANLLAPNTDPTASIQAINQLGLAMPMLNPPPNATLGTGLRSVAVQHWEISFKKTRPEFRVMTDKEVSALRGKLPEKRTTMNAVQADAGGVLDDVFGDIVNFFTNALDQLETVAVTIAGDVLTVAINGVNYAVTTARQIGAAVQMIFAKIAQGLGDIYTIMKAIVAFLEMVFNWDDILATHRVFKACFNSFLNAANTSVGDIQAVVQGQITSLQNNLVSSISALQQQLGSQTFNQYSNSTPTPPNSGQSTTGNILDAQSARDAYNQHLSRCQYVYSKTKNHFSVPSSPGASSIDISQILTEVGNSWNGSAFNFNQQMQQIQDLVTGKISSPADLFDFVVIDFLTIIQDFILLLLAGLDAIATAILSLVQALIAGLQDVLNANLNIPVISWLYKYVITGTIVNPGDDLTILDVLCLIFAVPVTILYKLLMNNPPFCSADADYFEANGLAWPLDKIPGSALTGAKLRPKFMPAAQVSSYNITPAYMALGICGAFCNLFNGALSALADNLAFQATPPPVLTKYISYACATGSALGQILQAPWSLWTYSSTWYAADTMTTVLWSAGCVPVIYDFVFTFITGALARYTNVLGPILDTGAGGVLTGLGIAAMVLQLETPSKYTGWDASNSLVPQPQRGFRFLILDKGNEYTQEEAEAVVIVVDVAIGFGSYVTQLNASIFDWIKANQIGANPQTS